MNLYYTTIDDDFVELYYSKINEEQNSGIDLIIVNDVSILPNQTLLIGSGIYCEPEFEGGYYLYPRSSIYKYNLILANMVGIIDNNYRGEIRMAIRNIGTTTIKLEKGTRLCQLCHPSLKPMKLIYKKILNVTERGHGGFGSTGK